MFRTAFPGDAPWLNPEPDQMNCHVPDVSPKVQGDGERQVLTWPVRHSDEPEPEDALVSSRRGPADLARRLCGQHGYVRAEVRRVSPGDVLHRLEVRATRRADVVFTAQELFARLRAGLEPTYLLRGASSVDDPVLNNREFHELDRRRLCGRRPFRVYSIVRSRHFLRVRRAKNAGSAEAALNNQPFAEWLGRPNRAPWTPSDAPGARPLPITTAFAAWWEARVPMRADILRHHRALSGPARQAARRAGFHTSAFGKPNLYDTLSAYWRHLQDQLGHQAPTGAELLRLAPWGRRLARRHACWMIHYPYRTECEACAEPFRCRPGPDWPHHDHPAWRDAVPNEQALRGALRLFNAEPNRIWPSTRYVRTAVLLADYARLPDCLRAGPKPRDLSLEEYLCCT